MEEGSPPPSFAGGAGGMHGAPSGGLRQESFGRASFNQGEAHEPSFSSMRQLIREAPDSVLHIIEHRGGCARSRVPAPPSPQESDPHPCLQASTMDMVAVSWAIVVRAVSFSA